MSEFVVARQLEVVEDGSCCSDGGWSLLKTESLEGVQAEVGGELAAIVLDSEGPVLDFKDKSTVADSLVKEAACRTLNEDLLRLIGAEELLDVLGGAFGDDKFARRDVEQGDAPHGAIAREPHGS